MSWALDVAARTLAQEVRGEPPDGQRAVACVIKNRLASGRWGHSLASVCLWRAQFSGWYVPSDPNFAYACNLRDDDPMLTKMRDLMNDVMSSPTDMTNGAMWYFNPDVVTPPWAAGATFCGRWGHQNFYKNVP